jgi:hypothetical protein
LRAGVFAKLDRRFGSIDGLTRISTILLKERINAASFKKVSFAKDKQVISKQQVMESRVISGNLKAFDETSSFLSKHKSGKNLRANNKKERRKRITLAQTSFRRDVTIRAVI